MWESSRAHTGEGLDTEPEHGENDSGYDAEVAEPETERRPVKNGKGYVEPGTDSPVENDDKGDDNMSKSYRRKSLPPDGVQSPASGICFWRSGTYQLSPIASMELASS